MSGGFCPGGFCPGGFCPRGDFVQGDFVRGGFCPGGFCPGTQKIFPLQDFHFFISSYLEAIISGDSAENLSRLQAVLVYPLSLLQKKKH